MAMLSVAEVGRRLVRAGRMSTKPLCVYGADEVEAGWVPIGEIDFCLAKAIYRLCREDRPPAYAGRSLLKGSCPGGAIHLGYMGTPDWLKFFLSTGSPSFRGGMAEHYRRTPQMVEETAHVAGAITALAENTVFRPCADLEEEDPGVASIICLDTAERVRNICALNYFTDTNVFHGVVVPAGSACATLVTYPSSMSAHAPRDALFMGPTDPTVNRFFPPDLMGVGIPISVARRMCEPIEESFVVKRPDVAFPERREA